MVPLFYVETSVSMFTCVIMLTYVSMLTCVLVCWLCWYLHEYVDR